MLETELNSDDEFYYTGANIVSIPHTSGDSNSSYGILNESKKSYNSIYNNLVNTKEISYFPNGNVLKENIYNYDYVQNLLTRHTVVAEGTNYPLYEYTENFYPYSYEYLNDPIIQNLNNLNKISTPIKVQTFRGELDLVNQNQTVTNLINSSQVIFKQNSSTSNFVLPSKTQRHSLKTNQYEDEIIFDLYDNKGNLLQFHNSLGIPTTIIYGYNQTLPIAKIEGASYTQVMQAMGLGSNNNSYLGLNISSLSNLDIDANTEQSLLMGLKNFRDNSAFSQFFITTYTYNPLVGVASITPPSGITEYFIYDTANRLQKTVDINGNIMNEYKYHYKQ